MSAFVAYHRVSTDKQGKSGPGLEAQQTAIADYLKPSDSLLTPVYVEVESGRNADRPQLRLALAHCKRTGATLLIAKLDRLARNVAFISALMEQGVPFVACDLPTATPFMLHVYAAVAEEEGKAIGRRTKAALAAAKAAGVKLGGRRGPARELPPEFAAGTVAASKLRAEKATQAAHQVLDAINVVKATHGDSIGLQQLARVLTAQGVETPRKRTIKEGKTPVGGTAWTATAVRRVLARVEA